MNFQSIESVSKQVRSLVSKNSTPSLLKKYNNHSFSEKEEVVAARHFLLKRGISEQEIDQATQYYLQNILIDSTQQNESVDQVKKTKKKVNKTEKKETQKEAVLKLTEFEFSLFEAIKKADRESFYSHERFLDMFETRKQYKGVIGSLSKKKLVLDSREGFSVTEKGLEVMENKHLYRKKVGYEKNDFAKKRVMVNVDGKMFEKSAYVRHLLKKDKYLCCKRADEILQSLGFSKLYYSEFKRCREQLGLKPVKDLDLDIL